MADPTQQPAAPAAPDPEAQTIYDELNRRGIFKNDQEAQLIGHVLRGRGVIHDPTQGGLVQPQPQPQPQGTAGTPGSQPANSAAPPILPPVTAPPQAPPQAPLPLPGSTGGAPPADRGEEQFQNWAKNGAGLRPAPGAPPPNTQRPTPNTQHPLLNPGQQARFISQDLVPNYGAAGQQPAAPVSAPQEHVQPLGQRQIAPVGFQPNALETKLTQQNAELDQLHNQFGPNAQFSPFSPVDLKKRAQAQTIVQLYAAMPAMQKELTQAWKGFAAEHTRLQARARALKNSNDPAAQAQFAQDVHDHNANWQALHQRTGQMQVYEQMYAGVKKQYGAQALGTGPYLPSELAPQGENWLQALGETPAGKFLGHAAGFANPWNNLGAGIRVDLPAIRAQMMLRGEYPSLPENPGRNPAERREKDQETLAVRNWFFRQGLDTGGQLAPRFETQPMNGDPAAVFGAEAGDWGRRFRQAYAHFTPWQKQLVPILSNQADAELEAGRRAKLTGKALADVTAFGGAELGGELVAGPAFKFAAKYAQPLEERLIQSGLNPFVKTIAKAGVRVLPTAFASGAAGSAGAGTGSALSVLAQGGGVQEAGVAGLRSMPPGFLIGFGIGGAHAALGVKGSMRASSEEFYGQPPQPVPGRTRKGQTFNAPAGPEGVNAAAPGPMLKLADGTEIDLRRTPEAKLQEIFGNTPSSDPSWKPLESYLWQHEAHRIGTTASPPIGSEDGLIQEWSSPKNQARASVDALRATAKQHADPQVAAILNDAANQFERGWAVNAVKDLHPEHAPNDVAAPPMVSPWRQLTPEQQAALPKNVRVALLIQDLNNSVHVLDPTLPHYTSVPKGIRNFRALETQADLQFGRAQQVAANRPIAPPNTRMGAVEFGEGQPAPAAPAAESATGQRFGMLETGENAAAAPAGEGPSATEERFGKLEVGQEPRLASRGAQPVVSAPAETAPAAKNGAAPVEAGAETVPVARPRPEVKPEENGNGRLILQQEEKAQTRSRGAASEEKVSNGAANVPIVPQSQQGQHEEREYQPGDLLVGKSTGARIQLIQQLPEGHEQAGRWHAKVLAAGSHDVQVGSDRAISLAQLRTGYTLAAGQGAAPSTTTEKEPWQQTKAEFVKAHAQGSAEDLHVGMARVEERGQPGIGIEAVSGGTQPNSRAVVFRDQEGQARGTLEFTVPGEETMGNKVASIEGMFVDPDFRGQGIATQLKQSLKEAGYSLQPLKDRWMTFEGAGHAHFEAVKEALAEGKPVPAEVLADYPKLAAQAQGETRPALRPIEKPTEEQLAENRARLKAQRDKEGEAFLAEPHLGVDEQYQAQIPSELTERARAKLRELDAITRRLGGESLLHTRHSNGAAVEAAALGRSIRSDLQNLAMKRHAVANGYKRGNPERVAEIENALEADLAHDLTIWGKPQNKMEWLAQTNDGAWSHFTKPFTPEEQKLLDEAKAAGIVHERDHEGQTQYKQDGRLFNWLHDHPVFVYRHNPNAKRPEGRSTAQPLAQQETEHAPERQAEKQAGKEHGALNSGAHLAHLVKALNDRLTAQISAGQPVFKNNPEMMEFAGKELGGSIAAGTFTTQDVYDALETAINMWVASQHWRGVAPDVVLEQLHALLKLLPTQTARTEEKIELQQFSTPPTIAYVAAYALNPREGERVLEPSAGTGSLAAASKALGAEPVVNEIAPRRLELLRVQGLVPTSANAERLNSTLPPEIRATAILMNPPFSATGGRVKTHDNKYGMRHLEEALKRLEPGGRLVAIMGRGMSFNHATAMTWWARIMTQYNVRANVGMPGAEYRKYGTSFDNQLIIIENTGPTPGATGAARLANVVTGGMESLGDLVRAIDERGLRNRPAVESASDQSGSRQGPASGSVERGGSGSRQVAANGNGSNGRGRSGGSGLAAAHEPSQGAGHELPPAQSGAAAVRAAQSESPDNRSGALATVDPAVTPGAILARNVTEEDLHSAQAYVRETFPRSTFARDKTRTAKVLQNYLEAAPTQYVAQAIANHLGVTYVADTPEARQARKAAAPAKKAAAGQVDGFGSKEQAAADEAIRQAHAGRAAAHGGALEEKPTESAGSVFVDYAPQYELPGKVHPAHIVTTGAMAAVEKPPVTYQPVSLDPQGLANGAPSQIQVEALVYAFQRFEQRQRDGKRAGFLLGDGTGVGKGITIASIVKEYVTRQRAAGKTPRILWLSVSTNLKDAANDDLAMIGASDLSLHLVNEFNAYDPIALKEGILFSTYPSFVRQSKPGKSGKFAGKTRREQLQQWLGDEPLIIFDESHKLKNALVTKASKPSQTASEALKLDDAIPSAHILYSSATGATELRNMAYMERLGLWGMGTAFPGGVLEFLNEIGGGGVGALELVSRDLVSVGALLARNISYEGVSYDEFEHTLTPDQRAMYNEAATAWRTVQAEFDRGAAVVNQSPQMRRIINSQYWGAHQRFFRMLISAMKVPSLIEQMAQSLKEDKAVIVSLIGTNEGREEGKAAQAVADEVPLDELDFSPREVLLDLVEKLFPVHNYEEATNDRGETYLRLVEDANGNLEVNPQALAMREAVLQHLSQLYLPENPLDQLIQHFGHQNVAELTGRKKRREWHNGKMVRVSRQGAEGMVKDANLQEMRAFQSGKKLIAILSKAADTGISLHASKRAKNQRQRHFYTLELNWSADAQLQTFGRAHRSDQANAPKFILMSSDVGGEKRFSSTIARRLASLGAITRGQREAASGSGDKLSQYNFETPQGEAAVGALYASMLRGPIPGIENPREVLMQMGILRVNAEGQDTINKEAMTDVPRFLNRVLALDIEPQNLLFDYFYQAFQDLVAYAKANDEFDSGVTDIKARHTRLKAEPQEIPTGLAVGKTRYVQVETEEDVKPVTWADLNSFMRSLSQRRQYADHHLENYFYKDAKSGNILWAQPLEPKDGKARFALHRPNGFRWKYVPGEELEKRYTPVRYDADTIHANWDEQVKNLPKTEKHTHHVITGTVLPLWKRLATLRGTAPMKTMRFTTDDGQRIVGIPIPAERVREVLAGLNVGVGQITPEDVYDAVVNNLQSVTLEGGMRIAFRTVFGNQAIEVIGVPNPTTARVLQGLGVRSQVDYSGKQRFWIPATNYQEELALLTKVLGAYPVFEPNRAAAGEEVVPPGFHRGAIRLFAKGGGGKGVGGGGQPSARPGKDDHFGLPDDEWDWIERNRGKSRKLPEKGFRAWMRRLKNQLTREFEHLPRTPRYAVIRRLLTRLLNGKKIAANMAMIHMIDALNGLSDSEYKLFNATVLLRDVNEEIARQRERWEEANPNMDASDFRPEVTGPWTEATAAQRLLALEQEVAKYDRVQEALAKRRAAAALVVKEYGDAREAVLGKRPDFDRNDYFRHLVLDFVTRPNGGSADGAVHAPLFRDFLMKRQGSARDIETGFVEAEFNALSRMLYDTMLFKVVEEAKKFDITPQLKRAAIEANDVNVMPLMEMFADEANKGRVLTQQPLLTEEDMYKRILNQQQAIGFDSLGRMAAKGILPDDNGRFTDLIDEIADNWRQAQVRQAGGLNGVPLDPAFSKQFFEYAAWLLKEQGGQAGSGAAGMIFKGIRSKAEALKGLLGKEFVMPADIAAKNYKGYREWKPADGNLFYRAFAVDQQLAEEIEKQLATGVPVTREQLRPVLAKGRPRPGYWIPTELADTLDNLFEVQKPGSVLGDAARNGMRAWKLWSLFNPEHVFAYELRNTSADAEAMLLGNPHGFLRLPQGTREMFEFYKNKNASPNLRDWIARGGLEGRLQNAEGLGSGRGLDLLGKFLGNKPGALEKGAGLVKALALAPNDFRDASIRYSNYLSFLDQIKNSPTGRPRSWGASLPAEINALASPEDKAYALANELVGAYDQTSVVGQHLRQGLMPFWSFPEMNMRRWYRLARNSVNNPRAAAAFATSVLGRGAGGLGTLTAVGWFGLKAMALTGLLNYYNNRYHGEEERFAPEYIRNKPHVIVTNPITGRPAYIGNLGANQEVGSWFGLDQGLGYYRRVMNGELTVKQAMIQMGKELGPSIINKIDQQQGPLKSIYETAAGTTTFPDVFNPRAVKDRLESFFDSINLGTVYRQMRDRPQMTDTIAGHRVPSAYFKAFAITEYDPADSAYNEVRGNVRQFLADRGVEQEPPGGGATAKAAALYQVRQALRFGDQDAANRWLVEYGRHGGTDDGYQASLKGLDPVGHLAPHQLTGYIRSLKSADQQARLRKAMWHYQAMAASQMAPEALQNLTRMADLTQFVKAMSRQVGRAIEQERPIAREIIPQHPGVKAEAAKLKVAER